MPTIVDEIVRLWSSASEPPDLILWWSSLSTATAAQPPSPHDLLQALQLDQQRRWQTTKPWLVEDYLANLPGLPPGIPWKLQLALSEVNARDNAGQPISIDELATRFPDLAETLRSGLQSEGVSVSTDKTTDVVRVFHKKLNGRYRLDRMLGQGKFGLVYLAWDEHLQRDVAIKFPTAEHFKDSRHASEYLSEARTLARLSHPHILPVYDIGHDTTGTIQEGAIFVVSRFIAGGTLGARIKQARPTYTDTVKLLIPIAEALAAAHEHRIIHRDVKPENVLIEEATGRPFLADFGLAIREEDYRQHPGQAGTPAYMSPEQVRGEGHRLDGRCDLFSLGVIFYEMLTGRRPFQGSDRDQLFHDITTIDPPPPRSLDADIPPQLECICLKALAKQVADRCTAAELVADLQKFLAGGSPVQAPTTPAVFKPKGLRSFDETDSTFFLELLPGLRTIDGLPECVAFWKTRIEEQTAAKTFSVGLIYGPSGCGKSSLVKAGLLPQLPSQIQRVYLEATPDTTEQQLLDGLRKCRPDLKDTPGGLREFCVAVRRSPGPKVLIVLDQFEQWLHRNPFNTQTELVLAMRQCDGSRLQAVIMIREDFYGNATDFMQQLDVPLVQRHNMARIDLFDQPHATAVLQKFGSAYSQLPQPPQKPTATQLEFVTAAVQGLTEDNKVISVRLALFAEMVRHAPWELKTLEQVGGAAGIGVAFLEETFSSPRSDIRCKRHLPAVRGILKALLPDIDSEIKGSSKTSEELQLAAGYEHRPSEFLELITLLDSELRLITPKEKQLNTSSHSPLAVPHSPSYQLTHDYLVPSIREWLTRKQKETATGRAELKLEDRTTLYTSRKEQRYLPGFLDWLQILILTRRKHWTTAEAAVMRAAGRRHVLRGTAIATAVLIVGLLLQFLLVAKALEGLAGQIQTASPSGLTELLDEADEQGPALDERLQPMIRAADQPTADAATRLAAVPARLVLVVRDESQLPPLQEMLLTGELAYVEPICTRLRRYAVRLRPQWLALMRNHTESATRRFRAALGVVGLDGDQRTTDWTDAEIEFIATELSTSFAEYQPQLRELLRPIRGQLVPALDKLFDAETSNTDQQISTALALADFAGDDPERLARLLTRATLRQTEILYPKVADYKTGPIRDGLLALTKEQPDENLGQLARVRLGRRRANAALTLLRQGERDAYFDALRFTDDPESLSQFAHRCRSWGVTPQELLESFDRCAALRKTATGAAKRLESRVMYGLLIALGSYPLDQIPESSREAVFAKLQALYQSDPSATVHSASGWLLRTWGRQADVAKLDEAEVPYDPGGEREWFRLRVAVLPKSSGQPDSQQPAESVQHHALTFVVFPAGEYQIGSPEFEGADPNRHGDETPRVVKLTRPFAMCDREVTWGLYEAFGGDERRNSLNTESGWTLNADHPACAVDWYEWMRFCRWLTSQYHGNDENWQCYRDPEQLEKDANGDPRVGRLLVERPGFRMPTESEWEVGAHAGQRTAYTFGSDLSLLGDYGWFVDNSPGKRPQVSAVKPPGPGGLHDVQGNMFEWVHDWYGTIEGGSVAVDPQGATSGQSRGLRGGSWRSAAANCRTASRNRDGPAYRSTNDGFRLALSPSGNNTPEADTPPQPDNQ